MNQKDKLKDDLITLNLVNSQIAELQRIKEVIENEIAKTFDHPEDCSKSYVFDQYRATITRKFIYSLNKDEYHVIKDQLKPCFNPVKERLVYDIDKKIIRNAESYANAAEQLLLSTIINKKEAKLHIRLTMEG